mmetsp:Transcript_65832/g.140849  ORF Transcript_65832/g.140849 Transcript_65832/m.140849 type:complete len:356 (-) Transcript_65832:40-1107(-)
MGSPSQLALRGALLAALAAVRVGIVAGYLGPLCCGDSFCCLLKADSAIDCWGGFHGTVPSGTYKAIACGGKSLVAIGSDDKLVACAGPAGYGVEECIPLIGTTVVDASVSPWGGSLVMSNGALKSWSRHTVYGVNGRPTQEECVDRGYSDCNPRSMALAPPPGLFSTVACGGKRPGHFCCAVRQESQASDDPIACWGDASGQYKPTAAQLVGAFRPHAISAGCDFICAVSSTGAYATYGHLATGVLALHATPGEVMPPASLPGPFVQASCGTFSSNILDNGGNLVSFGDNSPASSLAGISFLATSGGLGHSCALNSSRGVECWGANFNRQVTSKTAALAAFNPYIYPALTGTSAF